MYNWTKTDPSKFRDRQQKDIWELEQLINFGLNGQKINQSKLKKYFGQLDIDVAKKRFLSFLLWNSKDYPTTKSSSSS